MTAFMAWFCVWMDCSFVACFAGGQLLEIPRRDGQGAQLVQNWAEGALSDRRANLSFILSGCGRKLVGHCALVGCRAILKHCPRAG